MEFCIIQDQNLWTDYINRYICFDGGFLQSWPWGEFQKSFGRKVMRLALVKDNTIFIGWQIIFMPMPFGFLYAYIPRPHGFHEVLLQEAMRLVQKEKAIFIRIDARDEIQMEDIHKLNFSVQPKQEFAIDIIKTEEALLSEMKPKTRYNIKLAAKHHVEIIKSGENISNEMKEKFISLVEKTSLRQGIRAHPKRYYEKMIETLSHYNALELYLAKYRGEYISGALVLFFSDAAYYLHGGSDEAHKSVMAPYLVHWHAILDAKARGMKKYNFGGVSISNPSWEGITRFKLGFSPVTKVVNYASAYDLPIRKFWYRMYRIIKNI